MKKIKDFYEVKCSCGCKNILTLGYFDDESKTWSICIQDSETKIWNEVVLEEKDVKLLAEVFRSAL